MDRKCKLIICFHMHQPFYKNLRTGEYLMPWVRLHALRNYADIPALHERYDGLRLTYNLVPCLVEQILDYAAGAQDDFEMVSSAAADGLDADRKRFMLEHFFQLNRSTQIDTSPRYRELVELKGSQSRDVDERALRLFGPSECRDLQVLFNLAWSGWLIRERPDVSPLLTKGRNFSEDDKRVLLSAQREFLGGVLEPYRRLRQKGACEISASPYFHPILPLLCSLESAREALPGLRLPASRFNRPEDAEAQINLGLDYIEAVLGARPVGMWPSEGSVSAEACGLMAWAGVKWVATDRYVLANSLGVRPAQLTAEDVYTPRLVATPQGNLAVFFRDTELSDLLGFVYYSWPAKRAAVDFTARLRRITEEFRGNGDPIVSVILDGENAWAAYTDNGREFFECLFKELTACDWLETTTPAALLADGQPELRRLERLVAGSWIYGNLATWIGHEEKNRGWELLAEARERLERAEREGKAQSDALDLARREVMISEGSDWFWWYGDDHTTAYAREFDDLFREHLRNVYEYIGEEAPPKLLKPIKRFFAEHEVFQPVRLICPRLDGEATNFLEWINAGIYLAAGGAGSMHRTDWLIEKIHFGFDLENVYLRFDSRAPLPTIDMAGLALEVFITSPVTACIRCECDSGAAPKLVMKGRRSRELKWGKNRVIEFGVPRSALNAEPGETLAFYAVVSRDGHELERHPRGRVLELPLFGKEFDMLMWLV